MSAGDGPRGPLPGGRGAPRAAKGSTSRPAPRAGARAAARRRARRRGRIRLTVLVAAIGLALGFGLTRGSPSTPAAAPAAAHHALTSAKTAKAPVSTLPFPSPSGAHLKAGPNLAPGSNPAALPGDVLIADEGNDRLLVVNPAGKIVWRFPRPGDLKAGQTFLEPDDAFFTPDARRIVATEENDQVVSLIGLKPAKILWRYGTPGQPGSTANHLDNPDDAMLLPSGDIVTADIKNCSILLLHPPTHVPVLRIGENTNACYHEPPLRFGSPNGVFPLTNGNFLVSEINGDWVDEMTPTGKILWSTHPPGVAYPSDSNEVSPGVFLTVDYSTPGQIVEFNSAGKLLWRYGPPSGPGSLSHPSLCEPVPHRSEVVCNDDADDRVIVVSTKTNRIVWQYGHKGVAGSAPGYLSGPDGVDLAPPESLLVRHHKTMGSLATTCSAALPAGACTPGGG